MSPSGPLPDPAEATEGVNANPGTSNEQPISASELALESPRETSNVSEQSAQSVTAPENKEQRVPEETAQSVTAQEDEVVNGSNDGAILSEVRSSLQTISSGVQELATTVQDFLGLSDSESSASSDYDHDSDGGRKFSWAKCKSSARRRRWNRRQMQNETQSGRSTSAEEKQTSDDEGFKKNREIIPEIRECNLEHFQSRPVGDGHRLNCVDVLIAGDSLNEDIRDFEETVGKIKVGRVEFWKPGHAEDQTEESTSEDSNKKWIRRIRINSRAVMGMLRHVGPGAKELDAQPAVFYRPFQLLVFLHERVKEHLNHMEQADLDTSDPGDDIDPIGPVRVVDSSLTQAPGSENSAKKLHEKKDALNELTCFVEFMESRIMPDSRRYRSPLPSLPETIRYDDLWYLFKPGDLVYVPTDTENLDHVLPTEVPQQIFRVIQIHLGVRHQMSRPVASSYENPWGLMCHYIQFDGDFYTPLSVCFPPIEPFNGEKKVTELPIYPISYLQDDQVLAQAQSDGATYISLIARRSGFYRGWTLTVDPMGNPLKDSSPNGRLASPEHIESGILVDFKETFNAFPSWKPLAYLREAGDDKVAVDQFQFNQAQLPLLEYDKVGRIKHELIDYFHVPDHIEETQAKMFMQEDELGQFRRRTRKAPTGKFLALLPVCFFAYAVLERKFVQLSTRFVRSADLEANDKAFDKLEINRDYKRLILALVKSHFDKIETEKRTNIEIETQDLIRGKGKGVVILLHGVPGVGKTATAEAVALRWKKPLFPITCGDLGYTAETLEKSLNEIFRLAHHWGCILLLDEADVFITQRERKDLQRNALVSGKNPKLYY